MLPRTAVIVPYFQRKAGLLRSVVEAALQQECEYPFKVIVVDDGSPLPARPQLDKLLRSHQDRLALFEQTNAGPGAARNRGLCELDSRFTYVAFLDSDDRWEPTHLARAIATLERGYDFYFSDFLFPDFKKTTAFRRAARIRLGDHQPLGADEDLFEYRGDMVRQIVTGNIIGTSTVAYRFERYPNLRFQEAFFNGQDYLFWLDLAMRRPRIAFSSRVECDYGRGVNIYSGSGWGTDGSLRRVCNEIKLWKHVRDDYALGDDLRRHLDNRLKGLRMAVCRDLAHRIAHRKHARLDMLLYHVVQDPKTLAMLPLNVVRLLLERGEPQNTV